MVRLLRAQLKAESDLLRARVNALPPDDVWAMACKGSVGRTRARERILRAMAVAPDRLDPKGRFVVWRLFRPEDVVYHGDEDKQDSSLVINALVVGLSRGEGTRVQVPWAMHAGSHALGRLLERTVFKADPVAAMIEAHEALLAAPASLGETLLQEHRWALPAAQGAFLATFRRVDYRGDAIVMAMLHTWVDNLWPEQRAQVTAIRFREPTGRTLGEGLLLPSPLRPLKPMIADENGEVELFE